MPVVEKIKEGVAKIHIYFGSTIGCEIWYDIDENSKRIIAEDDTSLTAVWKACIEFIKQHNENTSSLQP